MTVLVSLEPPLVRSILGHLARLQFRSVSRFTARIAISDIAAITGTELYGGPYDIIPCGIDWNTFRNPDSSSSPRDAKTVLYVGRLERRKGVAYLLKAWSLIQNQYPDLHLVIGGDGPERKHLQQLSNELALRNVSFLGYVAGASLPPLLHTADIFCAPAVESESFGIILIEAMAAGLPLIAAANPGYSSLLSHHPSNLLVPPAQPRALAGALATLLHAPHYRHTVGFQNAEQARRYDWELIGARIIDVYQRARTQNAAPGC
ncbi:MAG: hypothetical protein NVS2B7_37980 [Herpetosiphon sp.]